MHETWEGYLTQGQVQFNMRWECAVYRAVGTPGRSNLRWVGTTREGRARAWIWPVGFHRKWGREGPHALFVGQREPTMEAETDLVCIGRVGRTRHPWEAEGLHLNSPSHTDASAPSLAYSCTDHKLPFCKRTVALPATFPSAHPLPRGRFYRSVFITLEQTHL